MKSQVSIVKCDNYIAQDVEFSIRKAIDLIGGISSFVRNGSRVLIKPNLLMAIEPERAITTHPAIIRAIIKVLKEIDCKIYIGDSPSVFGKPQEVKEVYRKSGVERVAEEEGIELVEFRQTYFKKDFPLASILAEVDCLISVPKFKTHDFMLLTGAVKNLFGLIPGIYKSELHKKYFKPDKFAQKLIEIYEIVRPALNIVDAIDIIEGDGPGTKGDLRHIGLILASPNALAIDSILARMMNLKPIDIPTIKEAEKRGLGSIDLGLIEITGERLEDIIIKDFKLPKPSIVHKVPLNLFNLFKGLLNYWPEIDPKKCICCKKCQTICPVKVIDMKNGRLKIGYKDCIKCFCCLEVCPEGAISIKRSLLAKILGIRG
jgi:uncharacterized protein (DUF362 family)/Pyruvate/2-oxoacid:ferredoxin oxidoreductase delta subunit